MKAVFNQHLSKPALIFGLSIKELLLNIALSVFVSLAFGNFWGLLASVFLYGFLRANNAFFPNNALLFLLTKRKRLDWEHKIKRMSSES